MNIERVQTGVRIERGILKVLKGLAEYLDMPLGELIEGLCLHAFDGKHALSPATREKVEQLKSVYGLTLTAADSHNLQEAKDLK